MSVFYTPDFISILKLLAGTGKKFYMRMLESEQKNLIQKFNCIANSGGLSEIREAKPP